jgi:hypothetical protein
MNAKIETINAKIETTGFKLLIHSSPSVKERKAIEAQFRDNRVD